MVKVSNSFKQGFGLSLGFSATFLIGIVLFLAGLFMVNRANKREDKKSSEYIIGIVLMILGVALGMGFGADKLLNEFS